MTGSIIILLIVYLINIWIVIYWIKSSNCVNTEWPPHRTKRVVIRTATIYLLLGFICCLLKFDALDTVLLLLCIILGCLIVILLGEFLGCDPILITLFGSLFKWVFDIPSLDLLFPSNKQYEHPDTSLMHLIGKTASVASTLRPIGEVIIDGQKHIATSENDFIEKGALVTVVAVRNSNLVVRANPSE